MKKTKSLSKRRTGVFGLKSAGICGIILLAFALTLGACSDTFSPPDTKPVKDTAGLTRADQLAFLKAQENHKIGIDELQAIVEKALATPGGRSVASTGSAVTGVKKVALTGDRRFAATSAGRSVAGGVEEEPVEVYEFAVGSADNGNEGFVLASNDVRIGTILAIAEGSLDDTDEGFVAFLNENLDDYIASTILQYNSITETEIEAAVAKLSDKPTTEARAYVDDHEKFYDLPHGTISGSPHDFSITKAPLLVTKWGQGTQVYYSGYVYNNYVQSKKGMDRITGCGPTAMAQIIAYYNYIIPNSLDLIPDPLDRPSEFNTADLGTWTGDWATTNPFGTIRNLPTITSTSSAEARGQVAALMYQLGVTAGAVYTPGWTGLATDKAKAAFESLGYAISLYAEVANAQSILSPRSYTHGYVIDYITSPAVIKSQLNLNRPIYTVGYVTVYDSSGQQTQEGHVWVMDGHGQMTYYVEVVMTASGTKTYLTTFDDCLMVHCNLGWDGRGDGWYVYGLFDTVSRYNVGGSHMYIGPGAYMKYTVVLVPYKP